MKLKFTFFMLFIYSTFFCQDSRLLGRWIMDKSTYLDGKHLEINNYYYSTAAEWFFYKEKINLSEHDFPAKYDVNTITINGSKSNYGFVGDYLLIKPEDSDIVNYFLKPEDFIKKYPEFKPSEIIKNNDDLNSKYVPVDLIFNYPGGFESYYRKFFRHKDITKIKPVSFKFQFKISDKGKIENIKILQGIDEKFDEQFVNFLIAGESYIMNVFHEEMQIERNININKIRPKVLSSKNLSKIAKIEKLMKASKILFDNNEFQKTIEANEKIIQLGIPKSLFSEAIYKQTGISYLFVNKDKEACENFKKAGSLTNFKIRNYLIDYCTK